MTALLQQALDALIPLANAQIYASSVASPHHMTFSVEGLRSLIEEYTQAAAQAVQAVPGWLPIESAPKDGRTLLLGCFNSNNKWRTMRGQWMSENEIAESWEEPDDAEPGWYETVVESDDIPNCWFIEPTHWMPLPPAPGAPQPPAKQAPLTEGVMDYALDILVAAGHITREKAFQTRDITRQFFNIRPNATPQKEGV